MAKRQPPRPKSTANLPPGLAKYWAAKGVPSKASSGSASASKTKSSSKRKSKSGGKRKSSGRKKRASKK